ncbi:membrane protein [Marmoricola endophyticus]|uniref:Membrane protein n=1 Tax=Marmoricola endophyticus TaxID=2040280 RepID=A0A917F1L6_9ACTN|nr:neutral zinc metallopeptidase [Marmoricola endophyticus]GGF33790.1 membrane protein [Marmoricola endophyticus]
MRFNPKARLDSSQIEDRTGGGGGSRGGTSLPIKAGGGIGGLVLVIALAIFAPDLLDGSGTTSSDSSQGQSQTQGSGDFAACERDADLANSTRECRLVAITNAVQAYWADAYPQQTGNRYQEIRTVPFSQAVTTGGCGQATSDTGPFYCPRDQRVYLDLTFFDTVLRQLGGNDTAFTEAYVVAHEYGHHIENLMGVLGRVRSRSGPNSDSVKLETMADCLAGVWTRSAATVKDADGNTFISDLTRDDIDEGIDAAKVVGDDSIQERTQGRINPEGWTHGSSRQRIAAFDVGLNRGTIEACNFFRAGNRNYPEA